MQFTVVMRIVLTFG